MIGVVLVMITPSVLFALKVFVALLPLVPLLLLFPLVPLFPVVILLVLVPEITNIDILSLRLVETGADSAL